jgi:hypothetical protein
MVSQCLLLLCAAFPPAEISESMLFSYSIGLEGVEPSRILRGTKWLLAHRREYMPSPANIIDASQIASESAPKLPAIECKKCDGTGYVIIEREGYKFAQKCNHAA